MKAKLILLASAALASAASGQTVVDIAGSTAGRGAVHTQILALLSGETFVHDNTGTPTAPASAARALYQGTYNGNAYVIRTCWIGSVNGVRDVALQNNSNNTFFDPADPEVSAALLTAPAATATGAALASGGNTAPPSAATAPEIGFSDVFQTSTAFTSPALIVEDEVGVIPFKWFKNEGAPAGLTGMTPSLAQAIYGSLGELPLSLFTGLAGDVSTTVYCTGRDSDSGSRITTMAETGYGVFKQVNQSTGTVLNNVATLTFSGNAGFPSGSGVAGLLGGTLPAGQALVGYLGVTDWNTAVTNLATEIAWNGVTLGANNDLIRNGQYTFWGFLHQNRMTLTGNALSFYDALKTGLTSNPGTGLVLLSSMQVTREGDGAPVQPQ